MKPGQKLYFFVAGIGNQIFGGGAGAGNGAGATEIRSSAWRNNASNLIAVAGGGGGAGSSIGGGSGGGVLGGEGKSYGGGVGGMGGSQLSGGSGSTVSGYSSAPGFLAMGGDGAYNGGGGGGGFYGGGGGCVYSGGGGGSNFAIATSTILTNQRGINVGDGLIAISISSCTAGYFSFGKDCVSYCPAGYYQTGTSCTACGVGTYSASAGQLSPSTCLSCPAGKSNSRVGQTASLVAYQEATVFSATLRDLVLL